MKTKHLVHLLQELSFSLLSAASARMSQNELPMVDYVIGIGLSAAHSSEAGLDARPIFAAIRGAMGQVPQSVDTSCRPRP